MIFFYSGRESQKDLKLSNLASPWDRATVRETKVMHSDDKVNMKVTGAMDQEGKETEKERGGKDPEAPATAHSESHCCISGRGREPCGRLGYPKSGLCREKCEKCCYKRLEMIRVIFCDMIMIKRNPKITVQADIK